MHIMVVGMGFLGAVWIFGIILLFFSISIPFSNLFLSTSSSKNIEKPPENAISPFITILLPVRNESSIIIKKLEEIISYDYPIEKITLLVVDSCSSDDTGRIASDFLKKERKPLKWEIISVKEPGKSKAINHVLPLIATEIFVMLDADAILKPDSVRRIVDWFHDECIGAVCGTQSIDDSLEPNYRKSFNKIRIGQSAINSTPIFEGSICAFRSSAIKGELIDPEINADDSQLALIVRRNGFRAIFDQDISFTEIGNWNWRQNLSRRIRRAQGLSRTFWRNKDLLFHRSAKFRWIFRAEFFFHLLFPWLLLSSFAFLLIPSILLSSSNEAILSSYNLTLIFFFCSIFSGTFRELLFGALCLIMSHIFWISGKKMNIWTPDPSTRI